MDHFERQLAQMMRTTHEPASFEPRHQERLREGVRARRRTRVVQRAVGSVLAVAGLTLGLFLLPDGPTRVEPTDSGPQPATSPSPSAPTTTPSAPSSSDTSTSLPSHDDRTSGNASAPSATTGAATASETARGSTAFTPPPTTSPPHSEAATEQGEPMSDASSLFTSPGSG
ncbi:hypothetical protein [Streptomyces sp. NPDC046862]|uniref:hypothetical protein n=1 Tax=Streptomyces sp. NPDC046862 TaxID=3154603 RepID=UPI003455AAB5